MKMAMKIDKSQVKSLEKFTSGSGSFRRTIPIQAGFTTFEVMLIGGAGGRNTGLAEIHRGAGGGGGGSMIVKALLKDLPEVTAYSVGAKGADGGPYDGGEAGGNTTFGTAAAYGGQGATGIIGAPDIAGRPEDNDAIASFGGAGGGNSWNAGAGGAGGHGKYVWNGTTTPGASPTGGTWASLGNGNGGGKGGGGGAGRSGRNSIASEPTGGAQGAYSSDLYAWAPGGAVISANYGGYGGGASLDPITGVPEYFGTGNGGAIALKLT